jgi:hypothetical protein
MKKFRLLTLTIFLLSPVFFSYAQSCNFIKRYFENLSLKAFHASDLIYTSDDCYVMVGTVYDHTGGVNYFILKTNRLGDTLWYRENNSVFLNDALFVIETSDSSYILATNMFQMHFVKYDKQGNFEWERFHSPALSGSFQLNSIIEVNRAIYAFAIVQYPGPLLEGILYKINLNGDSLMTLYNTPFLCGYNINATLLYGNDKIAISGHGYDSLNSFYVPRFFIIDTTGLVLHEKDIQNQSQDFGFILKQSQDSLFYFLSGSTLYKLDSLGNIIWSRSNVSVDVKTSLNIIDANTILVTTSIAADYQCYHSSGQYLGSPNYNCPFGYEAYVAKAVMAGNKLIVGGMSKDTIGSRYRCFIAEFDAGSLTQVSESESLKNVLLYPNPVQQGGTLSFGNDKESFSEIIICNLTGSEVESIQMPGRNISSVRIDPAKYSPGFYILKLTDNNGLSGMARFVVN